MYASRMLVAAVVALVVVASESARSTSATGPESCPSPLTIRASVGTNGAESDGSTLGAVLSSSGRYVAFASRGTTLGRNDHNAATDVFVRDLWLLRTTRVSLASTGGEADGESVKPTISASGRFVAFPSAAGNLVAADRNGVQDIFVRDSETRTTRRVSVGRNGEADGSSLAALVSADGSVVVFSSASSNLVPGDTNRQLDVFVHGLRTGSTTRLSVGRHGEPAGRSEASSVSHDGRFVAFRSLAPNLVRGDWNGHPDVFVHDRLLGRTERVNVSSSGEEANGTTFRGVLSGNGRYVGFRSRASNLVPRDTNRALDVFVHDRATGRTTRVSVASDGSQADASEFGRTERANFFMSRPLLSATGRFVAFTSRAPNLVPDDENGKADVFVHDLWTRRTVRVSLAADGREADGDSFVAGISADGRTVAFNSDAANLVAGDMNERRDTFVAPRVLARLGVEHRFAHPSWIGVGREGSGATIGNMALTTDDPLSTHAEPPPHPSFARPWRHAGRLAGAGRPRALR